MRLKGKTFRNKYGWLKVVDTWGDLVFYNQSNKLQWARGACQCTRYKFKKILFKGNYR